MDEDKQSGTKFEHEPRLVPSCYFSILWGERRLGIRLRRAGSHGKGRRKNSSQVWHGPTDPKFEVLPTWAPCLHTLLINDISF